MCICRWAVGPAIRVEGGRKVLGRWGGYAELTLASSTFLSPYRALATRAHQLVNMQMF